MSTDAKWLRRRALAIPGREATVPVYFRAAVQRHARATCIATDGMTLTYQQLWDQAARIAAWLADHGVGAGQRVLVSISPGPRYVAAYLGVLLARGVVVTLEAPPEGALLRHAVAHSGARAALVDARALKEAWNESLTGNGPWAVVSGTHDACLRRGCAIVEWPEMLLQQPIDWRFVQTNPNAVAQILYQTSSNGRFRGVTLTHCNLCLRIEHTVQMLALGRSDNLLVHADSLSGGVDLLWLAHLAVGGAVRFEPAGSGMAGQGNGLWMRNVSGLAARWPYCCRILESYAGAIGRTARLRYTVTVDDHVPVVTRTGKQSAGLAWYGIAGTVLGPYELQGERANSEAPNADCHAAPHWDIVGQDGKLLPDGVLGQIVVRGEWAPAGCWNDAEATQASQSPLGWLSGRLGRRLSDGKIRVGARVEQALWCAGHWVDPQELERCVTRMPEVAEAVVVAVAGPDGMERPVVGVVPDRPGSTIDVSALQDGCAKLLPKACQPVQIVLVPRPSDGGSALANRTRISQLVRAALDRHAPRG